MLENLTQLQQNIEQIEPTRTYGKVTGVMGLIITCEGLTSVPMGARCIIFDGAGKEHAAEVVGVKDGITSLMPFASSEGIGAGCRVYPVQTSSSVKLNNSVIGRVLNGLGVPIDDNGPLAELGGEDRVLRNMPPQASKRQAVGGKMDLGVRAINTFTPLCEGQRMGIFSGSGVGKSVLMSMVAKASGAQVNVIGLIGERGREVREFIEEQLGEEGMRKSVVIVATSDESPLMRRQAAWMTMAVAEYFRDCGFKVMLMIDSITRFAMAQREIGLSSGEPPTTKGFTPSVFAELPKLLERAGPGTGEGSISALFSVLVEGGDMDEPVADAVRGIVDGHIVLTRALAERNHFPAIDVLGSVSRMVPQCLSADENAVINKARGVLATYRDMEELIRLGAYTKGSDAQVDAALGYIDALNGFLQQAPEEQASMAQSFQTLQAVMK